MTIKASAAGVQILAMKWPSKWGALSQIGNYAMIFVVTFFSCVAMLASIGHGIVIERDWLPQVFGGETLTSVNAWVRRIDQTAMLLGPILASVAVDISPWVGGLVIAVWNICSLFVELQIMRKIYNHTPSLREVKVDTDRESSRVSQSLVDWIQSWQLWVKSPVFVPGLALAILYTNIFQLSYLAQAYAASHCVSSKVLAVIWIAAGICGFSGLFFF